MRLVAALLLGLAAASVSAADWDVAKLFERLASERPERAQFQERKYLSLLAKPVDSSGELVFVPPDKLEKRTTAPKPETVTVDRTRVTLERGGKRQSLGLRENPGVAVLVESIRATLTGDLASVVRSYSAQLDGTSAKWRLLLRPLDPALTPFVERIEISGVEGQVRTVEIHQADGDRSVMTISPAAAR